MRFAALAALACCCAPAFAFDEPAEFDPYEVRDVAVSAVADNAVMAKQVAIDRALASSAERVLRRVGVGWDGTEIDPETAGSLVSMFANTSEQFGRTGYSATVTVRFSPLLVRGYLARRGIEVVDQAAPPVLLIPVVFEDGAPLLWDEAADWRSALEATDMTSGLTPVRIARGTSQDRAMRADRLLEGDFLTLGEFRVRYRTHAAVLVRLDRMADASGMLVTVLGTDAAGPVNATVEVSGTELAAAADAVAAILSTRWKKIAGGQATAAHGAGSSLPVRVLLPGGAAEWQEIERRLESSGVIDAVSIEAIGETGGNVVIWYAGYLEELPARLAKSGIDLFEAGGAWLLQTY